MRNQQYDLPRRATDRAVHCDAGFYFSDGVVMRLIDADALVKALEQRHVLYRNRFLDLREHNDSVKTEAYMDAVAIAKAQPTIDPRERIVAALEAIKDPQDEWDCDAINRCIAIVERELAGVE